MSNPKRIVFCTYPGVYSEPILTALLKAAHLQVVGIVHSTRHGNLHDNAVRAAWRHINRSGIGYAAYLFWATDGYNALRRIRSSDTAYRVARHRGIPVHPTHNINQAESLAFLARCQPEYLLTAHFNQLLGAEALAIPSQGSMNIHPSLLPDRKGVDPVFYALLHGYTETGVTVHRHSATFDDGNVLAQHIEPMHSDDSLLSLNLTLFQRGAELAIGILASADALEGSVQQGKGTYDSWPGKPAVSALRKKHRLINWQSFWQALKTPNSF